MFKFKLKDKVIILVGKDKGKKGIISKIEKKYNLDNKIKKIFVYIEGLNLVNKSIKANPNKNQSGGIIKKESKIDSSNVALINLKNEKYGKIFYKLINDKKIRIFKDGGEILNWVI